MSKPASVLDAEFYSDERVMLMTLEQQGAYLRLLSLAARNGSVPAGLHELAQLLGVPARRFAARIWPALVACWDSDGDRMVPRGQAARPAPAPATEPSDKSERMRQVALARWNRGDASHAGTDARRIDAHAAPHASHRSVPQPLCTPSVPRLVQSEAGPFSSEGSTSRGTEGANRSGSTEGAATLRAILEQSSYRSNLPPQQRATELTKKSLRLHLEGMTAADLQELVALDAAAAKVPGSLLAIWIDRHQWRAVLDEQRMKAKQAAQAARKTPADDEQAGPLFAASVAQQLLRRQQTS